MKKLLFICMGLFMTLSFTSASSQPEKKEQKEQPEMGCVFTSCTGTICDEQFKDTEKAVIFIEVMEDYICPMM